MQQPLDRARHGARWALALLGAAQILARSTPAEADCAGSVHPKIVGFPVWSTDPNEGDTWGAMPVLIGVCPDDGHTAWIFAPSGTWNSIIHYTGTLRWYQYPDRETTVSVLASGSTRINYLLAASLERLPAAIGEWTDEASVRLQRSVFPRFYGIGPDTQASAETTYTLGRIFAGERRGLNVGNNVNVGVMVGFERDAIGDGGVLGLPLTIDRFPDAPGIHGATLLSQGLAVRYDDRDGGDYADIGLQLDLTGAVVEGISGSPTFLRFGGQANAIWPEFSWLSGTARVHASWVSSRDAPFYQQSELGGAYRLRGFGEGRFVDRGAWTIDLEQRIRAFHATLFEVDTDWRIDPFVTVGQVFGSISAMFSNPRLAAGVGLRVFAHPSVVGRVDFAYGGEGLKIYVELGYPY